MKPLEIVEVLEFDKAVKYLKTRGLVSSYKKAKTILLSGDLKRIEFKLRKPKNHQIYQFRITKKYRAFGYFETKKLIVFKISDHQEK